MDNNLRLSKNDSILALFEEYLLSLDDVESFVNHVRFLGFYLANAPCSKLYSPVIDKKIKQFQKRFSSGQKQKSSGRTLHVATQVYLTGGHTRVIENWINFSLHEKHDLILTEQYREFDLKLPDDSQVIKLSEDLSISQRISALHEIYSKYDKVIFHIHQHDVIPLIAMGKNSPHKFFFYNHADHTFNIGPSLVSEVYDMSEQGSLFTLNFRGAKSSKVIPFPLNINLSELKFDSKELAKKSLGLSEDSKVILSVGTPYKFIPNEKFNLFTLFEKISFNHPSYHFIFIGPDESFKKYLSKENPNIHFLGLVKKNTVMDYYQASDIYVDSLPVSGGLALIEGVLCGMPIITFDNGFNAFDAAVKFRLNYEQLEIDLPQLLQDDTKRKELQQKCLLEARRHQKEFWPENFHRPALTYAQAKIFDSTKLHEYCEMLVSKFPENQIPRTNYKLSNSIILNLTRYFPLKTMIRIIGFQYFFPLVKPFLSFVLDKKAKKR